METLKKYKEYLRERELSESTREVYARQAEEFLRFAGRRRLTKDLVIEYRAMLSGQKLSASTVNLYVTAVNAYLRYIGEGDCTVRTMRVQKKSGAENVINRAEYEQMLDYAKKSGREKHYVIMRTLALTGVRVSELKYFTVEALEKRIFNVYNKGKAREVYIPECLAEELRAFCKSEGIRKGLIFRGRGGVPIDRSTVYRMIAFIGDMVGIPKEKAHPHSFRHFFALTYMEHYSNLAELADILGHASLETTRIYTLSTSEEKRQKMGDMGL